MQSGCQPELLELGEKMILSNIRKRYDNILLRHYHREKNITTHLTVREKLQLITLAKKCHGVVYVEIGSYLGASSCFIAAGIKKARRHAKLFCIDTWHNDSMSEGERDTFDVFYKNTEQYRDIIMPLRGYSTEVMPNADKHFQKIDFLFIDGDHSYEACKQDWQLCSPRLKSGSLVIFHDIGWAEGVRRVVKEEVAPKAAQEGRLPNLYWAKLK